MFKCPWTIDNDNPFKANDAIRCGKTVLPPKKVWTFRRENGNWKSGAYSYKDEKIDRFKEMSYICKYIDNFTTIFKSTNLKI